MKLFRLELENIPNNFKNLEILRSFLCDLSREFSNTRYISNHLVA